MKLIAYLIISSLISAYWSTDLAGPERHKRKHKRGRLERLLCKFRRWRRRWRRLWRQWRELMDGTVQVKASTPDRPATCGEETNTAAVPGEARERALATQAPTVAVVDEANPTPRRGPGRPRTIPTAHGEKRQMYKCNVCGQPFSETAGAPFFGLKTPTKTVCVALQELADATSLDQSVAPQDVTLLQEAGVPGASLAPGAGLLSLLQTPRQLACQAARTDPDAWQRLAQEVATTYARHGCRPDGSPMVSERVVNVLSTSDANVSIALVPPYRFARSRA
jgi:hypothetical protein